MTHTDQLIWLVTSVTIYCLVAVIISLKLYFVKRATLVDPFVHFVAFLSLYTLPLPIRLIFTDRVEGNISPYIANFSGYIPISVLFCAMSLIVFYKSYYSSIPERLVAYLPVVRTTSSSGIVLSSAGIAAISLFLLSTLAVRVGGLGEFILLGYGSTKETVGLGYLAVGLPWLFVSTMFIFVAFDISRHRLWFFIGLGALLGNIGLHLVMGNRSMVLYILISFGTFFLIKVRYFKWKTLLFLGLSAFVFLNIVGMTRKSEYHSFQDFLTKSFDGASRALTDSTEGMFYTLTVGEFVVPFETLPQMVRTVGTRFEPWFGWSYLRAPVFLVPSAIYPDRPLDLANWYMQEFYGQQGRLNEGRQFFFLAEGYLNFGPFGIIFISIIWGIGWRLLFEWLKQCDFDPGATMIYALGLGYMFRCISGTFVSFVSGFTQQSLAIAILGLIFAGATVQVRKMERRTVV